MAQQHDPEPRLGTGVNLLNLFGLSSTTARICGTSIVLLIIAYLFIRFLYPCRSPSSLTQVVDQATTLFNKCLVTHAFQDGEYDRYKVKVQQITSHASEIASRTRSNESRNSGQSSIIHCDYLDWALFLWERLKDIVKCHRKAQLVVRQLEVCLMRASYSHAQYQLQRTLVDSPQPSTRSDLGTPPVADGYGVEALALV